MPYYYFLYLFSAPCQSPLPPPHTVSSLWHTLTHEDRVQTQTHSLALVALVRVISGKRCRCVLFTLAHRDLLQLLRNVLTQGPLIIPALRASSCVRGMFIYFPPHFTVWRKCLPMTALPQSGQLIDWQRCTRAFRSHKETIHVSVHPFNTDFDVCSYQVQGTAFAERHSNFVTQCSLANRHMV